MAADGGERGGNAEQYAAEVKIDIDNFKTINDRFGHATGDLTLQTIAAVCRIAKRDSDVVARIPGNAKHAIFFSPSVFRFCCAKFDRSTLGTAKIDFRNQMA